MKWSLSLARLAIATLPTSVWSFANMYEIDNLCFCQSCDLPLTSFRSWVAMIAANFEYYRPETDLRCLFCLCNKFLVCLPKFSCTNLACLGRDLAPSQTRFVSDLFQLLSCGIQHWSSSSIEKLDCVCAKESHFLLFCKTPNPFDFWRPLC